MKKNKNTIIAIILLLIIVNVLNVLAPYLLKLIIDKFTTNTLRKVFSNNFNIIYYNKNCNNYCACYKK